VSSSDLRLISPDKKIVKIPEFTLNMSRDRKPASVEVMASLDDPLEFGSESRFALIAI